MALAVVVLTSPSHKCCLPPSVLGSWRTRIWGYERRSRVGWPSGLFRAQRKSRAPALEEAFETRQRLLEEIMRMEPERRDLFLRVAAAQCAAEISCLELHVGVMEG